jgi:hypothetical protein
MTEATPPDSRADSRELRNFALLLGTIVATLFGLAPLARHHPMRLWPWIIAIALWSFALLAPSALRPLHRGWSRFGQGLGWVNTRVILTLLYAIVVTPLGLAIRVLGRDPMARKFEPAKPSYRVPANERSHKHMERPY